VLDGDAFPPDQATLFGTASPHCRAACPLPEICGTEPRDRGCRERLEPGLLDPRSPDFDARIAAVRGLDLTVTVARPTSLDPLPLFVPQVDGGSACSELDEPVLAVSYGVWAKRSGLRPRSQGSMRERLRIPRRTSLVLLLNAPDRILEADVGTKLDRLLDALEIWRPDVIVAPDFSVWRDDPTVEQAYSIARSLRVFEALQTRGHVAIPHVYWYDARSMTAWTDWLATNPVPAISIDLQCIGAEFPAFVRELQQFRARLLRHPRLLINGLGRGRRLREVINVWPEVSFTANLIPIASHGRIHVPCRDGSWRRITANATFARLHYEEVGSRRREVAGYAREVRARPSELALVPMATDVSAA
jgi:hypothetical protein